MALKLGSSLRDWQLSSTTITFTGAAGAGAVGTVAVFTVAGGMVLVAYIAPRSTTTLVTTTGTLSLGVTGDTTRIIGATSTMPTAGQMWLTTTPSATNGIFTNSSGATASNKDFATLNNIVMNVVTAAITAGVLEIDCLWTPLTPGATLS